ncbi:hypothetical protein Lal_00022840 [Lupinus albus]|nr:hypothetical protein Lal_00022840 [Lupinus albus]
MCNKCGRLHYGSTRPGSGNGCFHCKELGHIKRFCPKLDRRLNVIHTERARDHGRVATPSGVGTSDVDDPLTRHYYGMNAHNSKRKGEHTCIHIGGAYSRQVKIYHQVRYSQKTTLSRRHWFVIIKKGEIVKKILLLTMTLF